MTRATNVRTLLALVATLALGYAAGSLPAADSKPEADGTLVVTPVERIIGAWYDVEVDENGDVFAVRGEGRDQHRLHIVGGAGKLQSGLLTEGGQVFVVSEDDKRHKHRGHVTILK